MKMTDELQEIKDEVPGFGSYWTDANLYPNLKYDPAWFLNLVSITR